MSARRTGTPPPAGRAGTAPPPPASPPPPPASPPPRDGAAPGRYRALLDRAREQRTSLLVLLVLLALVAVVHATGMSHAPQPNDDEGTYVAQAWAVQHWRTLAHYTYWYDHPPLGWLLVAAWTAATGAFARAASAVAAGRELMLVLQLASAALLFALARRLGLRRPAAAGAVLLFALSPLALGFHRAVYLDNVATPFLLGAFVLALSPGHRLAAHAGAGLCFAAAVLAKETSLLLAPALLWQYWQVNDARTRRYSLTVAASLFVLPCCAFLLYATLRGELLPGPGHVSLVDAIRFQLAGRAPSGSPLDPGSAARGTIRLWLGLDPWLLAAAVVLVPAGLAIRRLRPVTVAFATLAAMTLRPGYLPVPLVIGMLPFASVLVAGVADTAWGPRQGRHAAPGGRPLGRVAVAACLVVAALVVAPRWWQGDRELMTADQDAPFRQADAWIAANVPREARLLVDDALWVDLVERGRPPEQVVWFYKLDTDRDVKARFPRGWQEFDYVVASPTMRGFPESLPQFAEALRHSEVAATFGGGTGRVEVRKVQGSPVSSPG